MYSQYITILEWKATNWNTAAHCLNTISMTDTAWSSLLQCISPKLFVKMNPPVIATHWFASLSIITKSLCSLTKSHQILNCRKYFIPLLFVFQFFSIIWFRHFKETQSNYYRHKIQKLVRLFSFPITLQGSQFSRNSPSTSHFSLTPQKLYW